MHVESRKGDLFMRLRKTITVLLAIIISFTMNGIQALAHEDVNDKVTPETIAVVEQGNGSGQKSSDEVQETSNGISVKKNTETATKNEVEVVEEVTAGSNSKQNDKTANSKSTNAKKVTKTVKATKTTQTKKASKTAYSKAELRLMSTLIYCEAGGESYAGKKAVGIVVMNRKKSKSFPNSVKGVIYQKYQFGPVRNGSLNRALARYDSGRFNTSAEKDCIRAAKQALSQETTVTYKGKEINLKGYYFFSGRVSNYRIQIGNHQFK